MTRRSFPGSWFLLVAVFAVTPLYAGTVEGRVTDADGTPLPQFAVGFARVGGVKADSGAVISAETTATTDAAGKYRFSIPDIFPGIDRVIAFTAQPGWACQVFEGVTLQTPAPLSSTLSREGVRVLNLRGATLGDVNFSVRRAQAADHRFESLMIAMDDGTELATDLYLPKDEGRSPAILLRTPYNKAMPGVDGLARGWFSRGYAVVVQDTRGRYASKGRAYAFYDDAWAEDTHDGLDTVEWITAQPWSNGKVGTWGGSALGITQTQMAPAAPKGLIAQHITVAGGSLYHDVTRHGGVFRQSLVDGWHLGNGFDARNLRDMHEHAVYGDYWARNDAIAQAGRVRNAALHIGGWYDIFSEGTINTWRAWQHQGGEGAKGRQYLVIGPWTHGVGVPKVGDLLFPANSAELPAICDDKAWFDAWLKRDPPQPPKQPAVHYYLMGAVGERDAPGNEWKTAPDWPVSSTATPFYLAPSEGTRRGGLSGEPSDQIRSAGFRYQPLLPTPTKGGRNLLIPAGSFDQRDLERRADNLVFETEPLGAPVEVVGKVMARLWVSTDVAATDIVVRLTDVYPDGRSMLVGDGIISTRFREGFEREVAMETGVAALIEVDVWSTALVFNRDHRIRIAVTSSNAPRFETCLNNWPKGGLPRVANTTIHCGPDHPSALWLPLVISENAASAPSKASPVQEEEF